MFPDSYDWIVNGLRYAPGSAKFEISHRAMLLPITFAFFSALHTPGLIVLFGSFFYIVGAVIFYLGLDGVCSKFVRSVSTSLYLLSPFIMAQSAFIGSDVAANALLSGTAIFFLRFQVLGRSRDLIFSALFFAVGIHAQYINIIFLPTIALALAIDDRGSLNFNTARRIFTSRQAYVGLGLALLVGFIFFIPRLIQFGVIYEERVQHASLIRLYSGGWGYYAAASFAAFTWPVLIAFFCGLCKAAVVGKGGNRAILYFMILWITVVLGFFATFYTWLDTRFLIYVSTPVFILAAAGLESITKRFYFRLSVTALVLVFSQITASTDPFDMAFALTPSQTLIANNDLQFSPDAKTSTFYLYKHWEEAQTITETLNRDVDFDTLANSRPLRALFGDLRNIGVKAESLGVYVSLTPEEYYIVSNRNTIYFGDRVHYVNSAESLNTFLKTEEPVLIATKQSIRELEQSYGLVVENTLASRGPYVAFRCTIKHQLLPKIGQVVANEKPGQLMDGIADHPNNWTSSRLGVPLVIELTQPAKYSAMLLHLFDFDNRRYGFNVVLHDTHGQRHAVYTSEDPGVSGVIKITLPNKVITKIEIIGNYNSDIITNPENKMLHITELELVPW
jgi:hypothetical protein